MKVLLFGATGMVGQGVLRECLLAPDVEYVQAIGRTAVSQPEDSQLAGKLRNLIHADLFNYTAIEDQLTGFDACFFCLGVSSVGMSEPDYTRTTFDLTLATAKTLFRLNPQMTFIYVSGAHTDSTEKGSSMWARVKGRTENALLTLGFRAAYMFRPGFIQPLHGVRSKTPLYQTIYSLVAPLTPTLKRLFPNAVLTTEDIGRAMLAAVRITPSKRVLEVRDIRALTTL